MRRTRYYFSGCLYRTHLPPAGQASALGRPMGQAWEEGEDAADEEGEVAEKGQSADEGENAEDAEKNAATMARIWRMNQ